MLIAKFPRRSVQVTLLAILIALHGCANLTEIRKFAEVSADATSYTKLVDSYASSPTRQQQFNADVPSELPRLALEAKEREKQAIKLKAYHKAVEDYMKSLGDLAADDATNYDKELGALIDKAVAANILSSTQTNALKSVSSLVFRAATDAYRQRQLNSVVVEANPNLQILLADMQSIVGSAFVLDVDIEQTAFILYYRRLTAMANERGADSKPREPVAGQLVKDIVGVQSGVYDARRSATKKYVDILKSISTGHQYLTDHVGRLDAKEVLAQVKGYREQVQSAAKAIRELSN